jgi:hypothetical protein
MAPLLPIRLLLGLFAIFFAYYFGRVLEARLEGVAPAGRVVRWGLRLLLAVFGILYTGRDWLAVVLLALAGLAAGLGFYAGSRPSRQDTPPSILPPGT